MSKVRVRYAPSPTGFLHIGNARTALFDYLFAKHYDGTFVLRIEDTDVERNVEGGEESQLYYLNWLGIIPDESAQKPNHKYGPYRQTERLEIYKKYVDYLLEKESIAPEDIYGYTKEEYTHTAVAAAVASGTADCGMGILSAARTYDLDFIGLWDEKYDFLVAESALENIGVKEFIKTLKSEEFRDRLESLGGYSLENPGAIIDISAGN